MRTATKRRFSSFNQIQLSETAAVDFKTRMKIAHDTSVPSRIIRIATTQRRRRRRGSAQTRPNIPVVILAVSFSLLCFWAVIVPRHVRTVQHWGGMPSRTMAATNNIRQSGVTTTATTDWQNDYDLVHVIQTRFMQFQPNLKALGQARLRLFEALTIPSIQHQSVNQFLWIIRTDPQLDVALLQQLIQAVSRVPNAVLVASNTNLEGFRGASCIADITAETVLAGSLSMVHSYHVAAASHAVLETRCDADDAISIDFVKWIQIAANAQLKQNWMVWCAENHMEWQYDSPWSNVTTKGALLGLKSVQCITPGLTWGYSVNTSRSKIPVSKHNQIHSKIPACDASEKDGTSKCMVKLGGDLPMALRARTPTSAGMDHVLITDHTENAFPMESLQKSKWRHSQDNLWGSLSTLFGVEAADLWSVRALIKESLPAIVRDALEGQCTQGHSCKSGSREVLERLLNATESQQRPKVV